MMNVHRLQIVPEVLITLAIMTSVRLHLSPLANAVAIKTVLHVGQCDISVEAQRKVLIVLRSLLVLCAIINACKR